MITKLNPNEIFVFGSNDHGIHGRGAALQAKKDFGAEQFKGEGFTGQCYALPTLNVETGGFTFKLVQRSHDELLASVTKFKRCALKHPEYTFLLTKVGCGLAGYDEEYMKSFFVEVPANVVKPEGW